MRACHDQANCINIFKGLTIQISIYYCLIQIFSEFICLTTRSKYCTVLHYTVLYCINYIVLYSTTLPSIVLYNFTLYCAVLNNFIFYCTILHCCVLYYITFYCTFLYKIVMYCAILYCIVLYYI